MTTCRWGLRWLKRVFCQNIVLSECVWRNFSCLVASWWSNGDKMGYGVIQEGTIELVLMCADWWDIRWSVTTFSWSEIHPFLPWQMPCNSPKKWFVVELCELIHVMQVDIANFELFSSRPKAISVFIAERYLQITDGPTNTEMRARIWRKTSGAGSQYRRGQGHPTPIQTPCPPTNTHTQNGPTDRWNDGPTDGLSLL